MRIFYRTRYGGARAVLAALLTLTALAALAGCGRKQVFPEPADGVSRFVTGEPLRVGDVILARSYGLIGAMFANHSLPGGIYSHGAMVYRREDGRLMMLNYRPTGMETCTPEEFFTRYNRLALVRYRGDLDEARAPDYVPGGEALRGPDALSATALWWLRTDAENRIGPDYHLDHDDHSAMFCLELTSAVYRDCGLPDPFHKARKADSDPLLIAGNEMFKADVYEIRSPSSVLENPDFVAVTQWLRPEYDLREEALNEELMAVVIDDVLAGLRPKRPRFGGRMKIRQVFFAYHTITTIMFWKPKQDLPDFIDAEVVDNAFMLYTYVASAKKAAKKRMYRETVEVNALSPDPEPTLREVRRIVREELDVRRDVYMGPCGRGEMAPAWRDCRRRTGRP
ncbi:MAG: hypothetical protein LUG50_04890 [Planctomycetaceae bacterium]|nr:hypothetical protein [Planctomycetaceae bacterium]